MTEYYSRIKDDLKKADKKEFYFLKFIDPDRDDTYINQFDAARIKLENNKKILRIMNQKLEDLGINRQWSNIVVNDFSII